MPLTQFQCHPLLGDQPLQYQKVLSDGRQRVSFVSVSVKLIPQCPHLIPLHLRSVVSCASSTSSWGSVPLQFLVGATSLFFFDCGLTTVVFSVGHLVCVDFRRSPDMLDELREGCT